MARKTATLRATMTVLVLRIPAAAFPALPVCGWRVVEVGPAALESADTIALLAAAAAAGDQPSWAASGLAADRRSSSQRCVRAWAAVRPDGSWAAVIGLAESFVAGERRCSIPWLVVDPQERRRGVGAGMVREALAIAAALGAEDVSVETLSAWAAARDFWQAILDRTRAGR